jgi:hypothetical protein
VRLGGYVILPRILDKGRAAIAGKIGEYNFGCPTDQRFLAFAGIELEALREQLDTGKGDGEILAWIQKNAKNKPTDSDIMAWSTLQERRAPDNIEGREFFQEEHKRIAPEREDISTWFDLLDLDDYVTFGGQA